MSLIKILYYLKDLKENMNELIIARNIILVVGWPMLILGSLFLFLKGRHVYNLVKGSIVGKVVEILVYIMIIEMYSLFIVSTFYMYSSIKSVYIVLPIFILWLVVFILALRILTNTEKEIKRITN